MSEQAVYKGKIYSSRSRCALDMIADGYTQKEAAHILGISDQAVSRAKKNLSKTIDISIRRARKQYTQAMVQVKKAEEKINRLSRLRASIMIQGGGRNRPRVRAS